MSWCTPFLYTPSQMPQGFQRRHSRSFSDESTMASLSHLMRTRWPVLIFRSTRLPVLVFVKNAQQPFRNATRDWLISKGNTLSCGSGRHATRKSPFDMLKQRIFLQIPVWIRNKIINSSYGKQRRNSPLTFTEEQTKRFWCVQCSVGWMGEENATVLHNNSVT